MTIFLALRNYYLRMVLLLFMRKNIQNLAIEILKALNDLSTPDFSVLFQLKDSLYGLRSNGAQKICIPNINSVYKGLVIVWYIKVSFNTLVQWSGILHQQKLEMLRLCHLLRKNFENGSHQIVNVNFA